MFSKTNLFIIITLLTSLVFANEKPKDHKRNTLKYQLFSQPFLAFDNLDYQQTKPEIQTTQTKGLKSPKKGMVFSLILPGSGELYSKSWLKGLFFLGVEAGSWYAYSKYHQEGKDIEDEYIAFADEYWSKEKWEYWYHNKLTDEDRQRFAHHELPETKTQQYYEMIGKYQKFNAGWKDIWENDPNFEFYDIYSDTSKLSLDYMKVRGESNDKLKLATTFTAIALANHVLSAIDAVWTVSRYNKKVKPSMGLDYVIIHNKPLLMANLNLRW